jgi:hypothetical protein
MNAIKAFLAEVPGAIRGTINIDEACRIVVLAVMAHQGVEGVLATVQANAGTVFIRPADAALYSALFTAGFEVLRRFHHGWNRENA